MNAELKMEWALRLVKAACGEEHGDGMMVTNVGMGYAEPGYHNNNTVWVLGNFNDTDRYDPETGTRTVISDVPGRLFTALERIGVEGEWLDEWLQCGHCWKIVRCSGDSYMWKPFYHMSEDGEVLCGECMLNPDFLPDVLADFVNQPEKCVTFCDGSVLEAQGYVRYNPDRNYQAGWHPGMNDKPQAVYDEIQSSHLKGYDVIFLMDETSQFYLEFSAFTKAPVADDDDLEITGAGTMHRGETDYVGFDTGRGE